MGVDEWMGAWVGRWETWVDGLVDGQSDCRSPDFVEDSWCARHCPAHVVIVTVRAFCSCGSRPGSRSGQSMVGGPGCLLTRGEVDAG